MVTEAMRACEHVLKGSLLLQTQNIGMNMCGDCEGFRYTCEFVIVVVNHYAHSMRGICAEYARSACGSLGVLGCARQVWIWKFCVSSSGVSV